MFIKFESDFFKAKQTSILKFKMGPCIVAGDEKCSSEMV